MSTPLEAMQRLDELAQGLDQLSKDLAKTETARAPVEDEYENFIDSFVAGLYEKQQQGTAGRMPGEDVRLALARQAMPEELLGSYRTLTRRAERLRRRISDVKVQVDAQRSILSAHKAELEATS